MNAYIFINLGILFLPLMLSFDRRVVFYRQWKAAFPAILITAVIFIIEDIIAVRASVWSFAPGLSGNLKLFLLPIGEWMFFICVPYACIFIYACVRSYVRESCFILPRWAALTTALAALTAAIYFRDLHYTRNALCLFAGSIFLLTFISPQIYGSRHFWIALALSYGSFLIVNGILTSVPVVIYNPSAVLNIRIGSIPLEDFFYNFALITVNFALYRVFLHGPLRNQQSSLPLAGEYAAPGGLGSVKDPIAAYRFMEGMNGR